MFISFNYVVLNILWVKFTNNIKIDKTVGG